MKISPQTSANNITKTPDKNILPTKNELQPEKTLSIVPLAADKKFGLDFTTSYTRAAVEKKFLAQTQPPEDARNILGITTKTPFPKAIEPGESQASVLKRAYEEYAFKAGISNEKAEGMDKSPAEMFVEERLAANLKAVGGETNRINNPKTDTLYTDEEWKQLGSITMRPTDADIETLKLYKGTSDYLSGQKAADELIAAMDAGSSFWADKPFAANNATISEAKVLDTINANRNNPDFQEGFINKLGTERFLKLEVQLKDSPKYADLMRTSLSKAANNTGEFAGGIKRNPNAAMEIAQKADIETLARLTSDQTKPMTKDFLVEAGKKTVKYGNGWNTVDRGLATQNTVDP
ncbi:MAG: hypothetical protein ACR2F2_03015, partial [Pyrinomonadaceae bacterium]